MLSGSVTGYFLFDVADAIDLASVRRAVGEATVSRLTPKPTTPPYVQYVQAPIAMDGSAVGVANIDDFHVRFKTFDYGVISVALTHPIPTAWNDLRVKALAWYEDSSLATRAEQACRTLITSLGSAVTGHSEHWLTEDYWVFTATRLDDASNAEQVLALHGAELAQILRGEREQLSARERDEVLRHHLSYLANDLVVATWNGAFVYDTEAGAQAAHQILEFANSQLLQYRYYDRLLDARLKGIYRRLERNTWTPSWLGRRYTRAARQVHALFIEVNELTDKSDNALKIAGDVYAARLFALAAARLGLEQWKANVEDKLKTLDDIHRFAVEQTALSRGELLEMTIVAILVLELVLFFLGIMR